LVRATGYVNWTPGKMINKYENVLLESMIQDLEKQIDVYMDHGFRPTVRQINGTTFLSNN
jgi:hypothetical protein